MAYKAPKIVAIGMSMCFIGEFLKGIFGSRDLEGCTVSLVDLNEQKLDRIGRLARWLSIRSGISINVEQHTDRSVALQGADFVICAASINRGDLGSLDFQIPIKHGIHHALGENGGPGALFHSMRMMPLVFDVMGDIERICPHALVINLWNPESCIMRTLGRYKPHLRTLGLCHGIFWARDRIAELMQLTSDDIRVWGYGLNHLMVVKHIRHRLTHEDLYPRLRAMEQQDPSKEEWMTRDVMRDFGYWIGLRDSHFGEYFPFGWEVGERDIASYIRGRYEQFWDSVEAALGGGDLSAWFQGTGEKMVDVIAGVVHDRGQFIESGVVYNQGVIPNLPYDCAVEVPIVVDQTGFNPLSLGPLPPHIARFLTPTAMAQISATEAAVYGSKELAWQAFITDPATNVYKGAKDAFEELWTHNERHIRKCI